MTSALHTAQIRASIPGVTTIPGVTGTPGATITSGVTTTSGVTESTPEDLESLRYLLDLTLQPLDEFHGFTHMGQVASGAYRYQLNFIQYALAMAQFTRTPAFTGYLAEAQKNAILKMCDLRVWRYWAKENLLLNWRWNPDPIVHQNVMYSGFFGVMLGFYETLNDDRTFSSPGALRLQWNERRHFDYDFATLAQAIRDNMHRSRYTQYACEPHFVYPMCNTFALNTLVMHDRLHGTDYTGDLVERVEQSYTQHRFIRRDGRFLSGRGPFNFVFPPFLGNDAIMGFWLHGVMSAQAEQSWSLVRERLTRFENGEVSFRPAFTNNLDFGNFNRNDAWLRALLLSVGREMGDDAYANALHASLEGRYNVLRANGARLLERVSTWGNACHALGRFCRADALRDLVSGNVPEAWKTGPVLSQAAYPDVLVAYAVSDGQALELVLTPGNGPCCARIEICRMVPGKSYRVVGAAQQQITADTGGSAWLDVGLNARARIWITPLS